MELFWERGYEAVTLEDIKAAMGGIGSPSFYAAFGSKEDLFLEAVELYRVSDGSTTAKALIEQPTARKAVEAMLRDAVASFTKCGVPAGCLVVLGAMNCSPASQRVQDHLKRLRLQTPSVIKKRLDRGIADGDLRPGTDTMAVAEFYTTVLHGLSIQARDGASNETLSAVVDGAMAAWKSLTRRA
jgi:AcrR family transcriptional regulator